WPKLTEVGGSTEVGGGEGGFYTQEQYTDLVNYAAERFITVVPEIDMPGHTNAALVSYPELNCNPKMPKPELYTGTEVGFSTFCTDKKQVYEFINDVLVELVALTPGPYIHIGGDESHVTAMKDYIPFIEQVQEFVVSKGKQVIGWDEITHAQLAPNTVAQFWDNAKNAQNGVKQGAKILMSPAKKTYLDMQYDSTTQWGLHWAAYIEVEDSYNWEPTTYAEGISREDILGVEAPLWSETVTNIDEVEYMVFPRLPGIAEIAWSSAEVRDWETYKVRLGAMKSRFEAMGINYYASKQVPWTE
ncbi:MAG: family 20 glycosylhydrolase, partial [Bacteroidetes bacterium]|nr:family 20 glycosylhydrolase [Bacteroidota bacterium]